MYIQLELLKEKNIRCGNKQLLAKIMAMQDAAATAGDPPPLGIQYKPEPNDDGKTIQTDVHHHHHHHPHQDLLKSEAINRTAMVVCENIACSSIPSTNCSDIESDKPECKKPSSSDECKKDDDNLVDNSDNSSDKDLLNTPPYLLKSGHAKTHSIIINLDENSRFTEEVTV